MRGLPRAEPSAAAGTGQAACCRSTRELWIERDDFGEVPPPRATSASSPGAEVRLRYGYIIRCTGADKDADGSVVAVHCTYDPATRSGTPGADARKVKGNIHWLSCRARDRAEVRLYDRLFARAVPRRPQSLGQRDGDAAQGRGTGARGGRRRRPGRGSRGGRGRRAQLSRRPQSRLQAGRSARTSSPRSPRRAAEDAVPVRAARLLRRRPGGPRLRPAGVQPGGDAQGFLEPAGLRDLIRKVPGTIFRRRGPRRT